jgi:membrane associated rhomboid family serine protease
VAPNNSFPRHLLTARGTYQQLGNMISLRVFGQVVEGVVRHGLFVILYLVMGEVQNMLQQLLYLWSDGALC